MVPIRVLVIYRWYAIGCGYIHCIGLVLAKSGWQKENSLIVCKVKSPGEPKKAKDLNSTRIVCKIVNVPGMYMCMYVLVADSGGECCCNCCVLLFLFIYETLN